MINGLLKVKKKVDSFLFLKNFFNFFLFKKNQNANLCLDVINIHSRSDQRYDHPLAARLSSKTSNHSSEIVTDTQVQIWCISLEIFLRSLRDDQRSQQNLSRCSLLVDSIVSWLFLHLCVFAGRLEVRTDQETRSAEPGIKFIIKPLKVNESIFLLNQFVWFW